MECPFCDQQFSIEDRLCQHIFERHLEKVRWMPSEVARQCWCGVRPYRTSVAEHFAEHGGVLKHFHDFFIGGEE